MGVEVTEVVTKFSFLGSTQPLGDFNKKLAGAIKGVTALATATYASLAGLIMWADRILKTIDPMAQLSRQTGIAVEAIQELGYASSVNGGSFDTMSAGLERLNSRIGEAVALGTGEGVEIFKKLGVDIKDADGKAKKADIVFDQLRQRIVALGLDQAQVGSIAEKLGLDPSAIQLLMKTNDEMAIMRERARELGILTQEQTDATADYNDSLTTMNFAIDRLKQQIAVGFAPQMKKLTEGFTDLIVANRAWLSEGISDGITILVAFGKTMFNVGKVIVDVVAWFLQFDLVLKAVIVTAGILMVAFFPVTSIVTLIVGLVLVFEDLFMALTGGKSVIGDFFKSFGVDLKYIGDLLGWVWEMLKAILSFDFAKIGGLVSGAFSKVTGFFTPNEQSNNVSSSVDNRSVNQEIKIDIMSGDPKEAGRAVNDSLQRQLNDSQAQLGNGGL